MTNSPSPGKLIRCMSYVPTKYTQFIPYIQYLHTCATDTHSDRIYCREGKKKILHMYSMYEVLRTVKLVRRVENHAPI